MYACMSIRVYQRRYVHVCTYVCCGSLVYHVGCMYLSVFLSLCRYLSVMSACVSVGDVWDDVVRD